MNDTEYEIKELLQKVDRVGMDTLLDYMNDNEFFTAPASTRFHGCYEGGLADHSLRVYQMTSGYNDRLLLGVPEENIIVAGICHDFCKLGAYIGTEKPYKWNRNQPKGHAALSVERVKQFIELEEIEEKMILYHMGVYGLIEFDEKKGEYPLRGGSMANAWYHHPIVKVMYFCDEIATFEEKAREQ